MKLNKKRQASRKPPRIIEDYDAVDTSGMIDRSKRLKYEDLGIKLPEGPPTQVISIRLPSKLLNELRSISSEADIPYQALIMYFFRCQVFKIRFSRRSFSASVARNGETFPNSRHPQDSS